MTHASVGTSLLAMMAMGLAGYASFTSSVQGGASEDLKLKFKLSLIIQIKYLELRLQLLLRCAWLNCTGSHF